MNLKNAIQKCEAAIAREPELDKLYVLESQLGQLLALAELEELDDADRSPKPKARHAAKTESHESESRLHPDDLAEVWRRTVEALAPSASPPPVRRDPLGFELNGDGQIDITREIRPDRGGDAAKSILASAGLATMHFTSPQDRSQFVAAYLARTARETR
jgi:hypothetical protein